MIESNLKKINQNNCEIEDLHKSYRALKQHKTKAFQGWVGVVCDLGFFAD